MNESNAIIFDLDGTLVDSLEDITDALNRALVQFNCDAVEPENVRGWIGDGLPVLCQRVMTHKGVFIGLDQLVSLVRVSYETNCTKKTRPYRNILKMLKLLKSAKVPLAVLSNKPHALTLRVLEQLKLVSFFRAVRGYIREQDKKPSPKQAIALADEMNRAPNEVLLVGDSVVDIQTARRAGMMSVAVTWGFQKKSELTAEKPDLMIDDPLQLLNFLKKRNLDFLR